MAMKCPICSKQTDVLSTRERKKTGATHRRYQCHNNHRFSTKEEIIPGTAKIQEKK